jgi:hypothetical protein
MIMRERETFFLPLRAVFRHPSRNHIELSNNLCFMRSNIMKMSREQRENNKPKKKNIIRQMKSINEPEKKVNYNTSVII